MKPAITTITLLVANVLLIGYILIIDRYRDDTETRLSESVRLANFDREAVAKVMLKTAEGDAEIIRHPDGSWHFVAPFKDRFDPQLMSQLLDDAGALQINDTVSVKEIEKEGWDDNYFGLGQGGVAVQLLGADGTSLAAFELGGPTPFERIVYARRSGDGSKEPVHFVWGDLRDIVTRKFGDLRDRKLIYTKVDDVFRVKFRPPSPDAFELHVERGPDNRWWMKAPFKARCDQDLVNDLVAQLAKLRVAEIVDQPAADMEAAFDEKRYEIVLRQRSSATDDEKEKAKITIEFGRQAVDDSDLYVLARVSDRPGAIFRIDRRVHHQFELDGNSLRDRTLGDFEYDAVASVRIRRTGQEDIFLERKGSVWALRRDPNDPAVLESANGRMVKDLIEKINQEEVLDFVSDAAADLEPFGLKEPPVEVTVTSLYFDPDVVVEPGELPRPLEIKKTLMFGLSFANQPGGEAVAAFKGDHSVFKIANVLPPQIARSKALDYRTLQIWPMFTPFDLRKVTLQDKLNPDPLELEYDHERNLWRATRGNVDVTDNIDRVVLDGYLQFIGRPPRGKDWTLPSKLADLRLADPDLSITIDLIDPLDRQTPRQIQFSASATRAGAEIYYGRVQDQGSDVLVLDGKTMRALSLPLKRISSR